MAESQYTHEELQQLHHHLYKITGEIIRVCREHHITYFLIGGSAIGVHFWQGIIPWDDDIDIGMRRDDYERFLQVAPHALSKEYFLQTPDTEQHTPFWFAKVREHGTRFVESHFRRLNIHHGIFVDVFPFDDIPDSKLLERLQYHVFGFLHSCFIGKDVWQWRHCGTPQVDNPLKRGFVGCLLTRIIVTLLSKRTIFLLLRWVQTWFNGRGYRRCKNIVTQSDIIPIQDVMLPREVPFGPLTVCVPHRLEDYLHTHYGTITKYLPPEQRGNHRPSELTFNTPSKTTR